MFLPCECPRVSVRAGGVRQFVWNREDKSTLSLDRQTNNQTDRTTDDRPNYR